MTKLTFYRLAFAAAVMAASLGMAALIQLVRDQRMPRVCDCGASDWLEADECATCLMCGNLRRRG